jgi:hypothetical protein
MTGPGTHQTGGRRFDGCLGQASLPPLGTSACLLRQSGKFRASVKLRYLLWGADRKLTQPTSIYAHRFVLG